MESVKLNINLSVNQLIEAVKQLSPKDKLKINEVLWNGNSDIPKAHQKLVLDRISKSQSNPERLLDWDEISKEL